MANSSRCTPRFQMIISWQLKVGPKKIESVAMVVKRMNWKFAPTPGVHQVWMQLFAAGSLLFGTSDLHIFWVKLWRIIGTSGSGEVSLFAYFWRKRSTLITYSDSYPLDVWWLSKEKSISKFHHVCGISYSDSVFLIFIRTFVMSWPFQNKFSIRTGNSGKAVVLAL